MSFDNTWIRATDFLAGIAKSKPAKARTHPSPPQWEPPATSSTIEPKEDSAATASTTELEKKDTSPANPSRSYGEPILTVEGLTVSFPKSGTIFEDLNLTVRDGEKVCIVGSNGAGKSTLVKACLGVVQAQAGSIELFGERYDAAVGPSPEQLAKIGMVHQRHNLIARSTALGNALHGALGRCSFKPALWYQSFAPDELREQALYYLERVGIGHKAGNLAKELSGGQSQRVAIARALMQQPKLIIADEPVASLDPVSGQHVMEVFSDLVDEENKTLIFISHHVKHAVEFADRVVGIKNKKIGFDVAAAETSYEELESIYGE